MRDSKIYIGSAILLAIIGVLFFGCTDYSGEKHDNLEPIIVLYNNPSDGDTLGAAPVICWHGFDTDGKVYEYEWIDLPKAQSGSSRGVPTDVFEMYKDNSSLLADVESVMTEAGTPIKWAITENTCDTVFLSLLVDTAITEHLFCIRAIDTKDTLDPDTIFSEVSCATYYRSNLPPDSCVIVNDTTLDGKEFWILKDFTYSWNGIDVAWSGGDPDNSIILEYFWCLVDINTGDTVLTSLIDDSLGGVNAGLDSTDGWIRSTTVKLHGYVPSGTYYLIVQIRDDAFYAGKADTVIVTLASPDFDISDSTILQEYVDGTYEHKILIIDQNNAILYPNAETVWAFYDDIFNGLKSDGVIADYERRLSSSGYLEVPRVDLAEYSILYILDQEFFSTGSKLSQYSLEELMQYVKVGGRVIVDGRDVFGNESPDWDEIPSYDYFGLNEYSEGCIGEIFDHAIANKGIHGYPDLVLDASKTFGGATAIKGVTRLGKRSPSYDGSVYTEILYRFGLVSTASATDTTNYHEVPVAVRRVTPSYRSAYFAFPLYLMNNDNGEVEDVIRETVEFIKTHIIPPEPDTTES